MNYSRRQLEALGEPLGESVTRAKPGGRIYGGGDSSAPSQMTQISQTYGPEFQPFASEMMKRTGALVSQPYERYQYNRIAGFDPMQLQAQQAAANMRVSPYLQQGAGIAGNVANKAMNLNYQPGQFQEERVAAERAAAERATTGRFTDPGVASSYMSPYMQNVVDIQKREAQRQADIAGTQRGSEAVRAGAFGGSRQAILEAEAQRNLSQQMGDIQARGSQAAFEQAAQQFQTDEGRNLAMQQANVQAQLQAALANQQTGLSAALANQAKNLEAQQLREQSRQFGADLGLRGLQTALQGSGQLGQMAGTQFGQAKDIVGMQATAGAERQAQKQRKLSQDYEDFLAQKRYPYEQLQFGQSMLRGMPMSGTESIYKAPPSTAAQFGGLASIYAGGRQAGYFANGGLTDLALYNMTR
ncbi:MAG: hypothetical protein EBZ61_08110 [Micrococcales bacterium]|nr:hypothetical protein [Micrococcales bacterium]